MHPNSGSRRRHSDELKAKVLAACEEPGASISRVALAHGLNSNLVHKWRSGRGVKRVGVAVASAAANMARAAPAALTTCTEFVAVEMPALPEAATRASAAPNVAPAIGDLLIQIELRRGPLHLNVRWPTSAARDCTAWLRELTSLLK
jgi:transposase